MSVYQHCAIVISVVVADAERRGVGNRSQFRSHLVPRIWLAAVLVVYFHRPAIEELGSPELGFLCIGVFLPHGEKTLLKRFCDLDTMRVFTGITLKEVLMLSHKVAYIAAYSQVICLGSIH